MERDIVINIFNELISGERDKVCFSKGYKVFEETYEAFKKEFNLERKEEGYIVEIKYVK